MPDPLHVLIVEDSPKDAELLLLELSKAGYLPDWKRVDTEAAYVDSLHPGLDLILSDQTMPQFNGLRALELLKRRGLEIPFILISGTVGEESAVAAMKLGVTDYLLRDRLARLGTGTTFRLFLPAMPASEPDKPVVSTLPRGDGETVLIIDDESSVITVTRKTLEEFGYRVLSASNGAEAVAVYAQHQGEIALVLTDMLMPVMNGSATIQALVQINPAVKIIVVSGMNGKREAHHAEGPGVAHFLHKPFTARSLLEKVRATLEEENAEKQGRLS